MLLFFLHLAAWTHRCLLCVELVVLAKPNWLLFLRWNVFLFTGISQGTLHHFLPVPKFYFSLFMKACFSSSDQPCSTFCTWNMLFKFVHHLGLITRLLTTISLSYIIYAGQCMTIWFALWEIHVDISKSFYHVVADLSLL